jgi:hypothetical protein
MIIPPLQGRVLAPNSVRGEPGGDWFIEEGDNSLENAL